MQAKYSFPDIFLNSDTDSSIVFLQFLTVGTNMIAIWGVESRLYLAIDEDGTVFTTVSQ
jgi:hypothetical protein